MATGNINVISTPEALSNYDDAGVSKRITSGSANSIKTPGRYYVTSDVSNTPTNGASGYMDVYAFDDNRVAQVFRQFNSNVVFERKLISGTWGDWTSIPVPEKVIRSYYDTSYGYYGFETQNVASGTNGYVSMLVAPDADRMQLKYTKNGTLTTNNYVLANETRSFTQINSNCYWISNGSVCTVWVSNVSPSTTETTIATLPTQVRPKTELRFGGICHTYGSVNMQIKITTAGAVMVQANGSYNYGYGTCTYVI